MPRAAKSLNIIQCGGHSRCSLSLKPYYTTHILLHPKVLVFPGISVSKKWNPLFQENNSFGAQLDAPDVKISLDVMENPSSELLTPFSHVLCNYCFSLGIWLALMVYASGSDGGLSRSDDLPSIVGLSPGPLHDLLLAPTCNEYFSQL